MIEPSLWTVRMIQRCPFLTQAPWVVVRSQRAFLRVAIQSPAEAVKPSARVRVAVEAGSLVLVGFSVSRSRRARSLSSATSWLVGANRMESRPAARSAAHAV